MKNKNVPAYVWLSFLAVLLLSAFSIRKRTEVEAENRSVSIAVEFEVFEALAAGQGLTTQSALADAKAQGLRALVLNEESIGELVATGRVSIVGSSPTPASPTGLSLMFVDTSVIQRVRRGLLTRYGALAGPLTVSGNILQLPPISAQLIRTTPIGLKPREVALTHQMGLVLIARFANWEGESADCIAKTLRWAKEDGTEVFLPLGEEVLGYRTAVEETLEDLRKDGILYASPEFAKIAGDTDIVERGKDIVVRLHGAQVAELDKLSPIDAQDRYVKAARERNMRILLLRPLSTASPAPSSDFNAFILGISRQIEKNRQVLGPPHALREPGLSKVFFPVLGLFIAPVVWFVAASFVPGKTPRFIGGVLLFMLALACYTKLGKEAMALLSSMAFPILAFFTLDWILPRLQKSELIRVLVGFWMVSLISLAGGISVAGLLNDLGFYIHASEFQAVKVSVFLPVVVIGVHYFFKLTDWRRSMRSPMTWGTTTLGLVLGVVLAVMIARTGNDTGISPSGGEIVFRDLLDRYLYVRPRTKEFLVGHPILVLGIAMLGRFSTAKSSISDSTTTSTLGGWTILALMVGAIGQTSVVNTLCHIHIPFFLSLIRDIEGMVLGCMIGVALWAVTRQWLPKGE